MLSGTLSRKPYCESLNIFFFFKVSERSGSENIKRSNQIGTGYI